jgi:hypothetical protein
MPRFAIGERVEPGGLLGELRGGAAGRVVSMVQNRDGIPSLDEYEIVFEDSTQLRFCSFQLTHVGTIQIPEDGKALMQ